MFKDANGKTSPMYFIGGGGLVVDLTELYQSGNFFFLAECKFELKTANYYTGY